MNCVQTLKEFKSIFVKLRKIYMALISVFTIQSINYLSYTELSFHILNLRPVSHYMSIIEDAAYCNHG